MGKSLEDMGTWEKFLNRTAMACAERSRIDKWDLIKLQFQVLPCAFFHFSRFLVKNEKCTLNDLDNVEKTENHGK